MIKVVTVRRTCLACPSQWEGESSAGEFVYARYRGGRMRVDVAPNDRIWSTEGHTNFVVYEEDFGDTFDGYITFNELKEHTASVLSWTESDGDDGKQLEMAESELGDNWFSDFKSDA